MRIKNIKTGNIMEKSILQRSISFILLGLILLFALTSIGNVAEFVHQYHEGWTGYTLGICFGVTLFAAAYIASVTQDAQTRTYALVVAIIFGCASATFQTALYVSGGAKWYIAATLSFVPILAGEVGLALLESSYSQEHATEAEQSLAYQLTRQVDDLEAQIEHYQSIEADKEALFEENSRLKAAVDQIRQEYTQLIDSSAQITPNSIISELPAKLRDDLLILREIVAHSPVKSADEFSKKTSWGRTKSHSVFQMAKAIRLIEFSNSEVNAYVLSAQL